MATLDLQIATGGDDWYWTGPDGTQYFSEAVSYARLGYYDGSYTNLNAGMRFAMTGPVSGNTISEAHLTLMSYEVHNEDTVNVRITAEDADNPSAPLEWSQADGVTPTTAYVDWTIPHWGYQTWHDSPDISSVIQEVVNRPGWSSGNYIKINIRNNSSTTTNGTQRLFICYELVSTAAPKMHVEYVSAADLSVSVNPDSSAYRVKGVRIYP